MENRKPSQSEEFSKSKAYYLIIHCVLYSTKSLRNMESWKRKLNCYWKEADMSWMRVNNSQKLLMAIRLRRKNPLLNLSIDLNLSFLALSSNILPIHNWFYCSTFDSLYDRHKKNIDWNLHMKRFSPLQHISVVRYFFSTSNPLTSLYNNTAWLLLWLGYVQGWRSKKIIQ